MRSFVLPLLWIALCHSQIEIKEVTVRLDYTNGNDVLEGCTVCDNSVACNNGTWNDGARAISDVVGTGVFQQLRSEANSLYYCEPGGSSSVAVQATLNGNSLGTVDVPNECACQSSNCPSFKWTTLTAKNAWIPNKNNIFKLNAPSGGVFCVNQVSLFIQYSNAPLDEPSGLGTGFIVLIVIVVLCVVLVLVGGIGAFVYQKFFNKDPDELQEVEDKQEAKRQKQTKAQTVQSQSMSSSVGSPSRRKNDLTIAYNDIVPEKRIEKGPFGDIYKGLWRSVTVTMQKLRFENTSEQLLSDFDTVIGQMSALRPHPNCVTFLGCCADPNFPLCIITEFLPNSLKNVISNAEIMYNRKIAWFWARNIANGMLHLHTEKMLHLDLSCRNLRVEPTDQYLYNVKVGNFGLAKFIMDENGVYSGTSQIPIRWCAPEVLAFNRYSQKSDIWSFGAVLYEIIARTDPWEDFEENVVLDFVGEEGKLPPYDQFNFPQVLTLMDSCFKYSPEDRPMFSHIAEFLKQPLDQGAEEEIYPPVIS